MGEQLNIFDIDPHKNLYARFELEDVIADLLDHAEDKAKIKVRIKKSFSE